MKKFLSLLMSVAVLFSVTSCSQEDITTSIADGNEVLVTLTTTLASVDTRAVYGNGANVDKLIYNVYDAQNGDLLTNLSGTATATSPGKFTVQLKMLKGMKYHFVFWAQNKDCEAYTVNEDKTVKVDYAKIVANDDKADAFFGYVPNFDPVTATSTTFKLYRPFAQLNAATSDYDVLTQSGVTDLTSTVTLRTYNTFDISTGDVTGNVVDVVFKEATTIPHPTVAFHKGDYTYLSMNYVLAAKNQNITNTHFTFAGKKNGNDVVIAGTSYANIPLQQNFRTNILGALLTKTTDFTVEIVPAFNNAEKEIVGDAASAQAALDNAVAGTTIQLQPGVNYGTLLIRPVLNAAHTESGNWVTTNYATELARTIENVTIIGAEGAKVDAIQVDYGYKGSSYISGAPDLMCYANVKNLTIDGVEFTGASDKPIFIDLMNTTVDGLTVKNCKLSGNTAANLVYIYGSQGNHTFATSSKNVTITDNIVDGVLRLCELRGTENVTITGNTIKNTTEHGMLLAKDPNGESYSGNVTITGNTADSIHERFVRMAGAGDAVVVIKDNIINNYLGADSDFIKVTDANTTPVIENNILNYTVSTTEMLQTILDSAKEGTVINLEPNVNYGVVYMGRPTKSNATTMYCENHNFTTTDAAEFKAHLAEIGWHTTPRYTTTLKNVTINGATGTTIAGLVVTSGHAYGDVYDYVLDKDYDSGSAYYSTLNIENLLFSNVAFTGKIDINTSDANSVYNGVKFDKCTFTTGGTASTNGAAIRYYNEMNNGNVKNIVVNECTFNNCYQGVYVQQVNGVTVTDCNFDTTGHNAIALQSTGGNGAVNLKNVVITGNTFNNIADRIIRFNEVGADSNITIQNNTATNSGKSNGEVMKAESIAAGVTTAIGNNNWGAGAIVVNDELKDKIFSVTTADEVKTILAQDITDITINLEAGTYEGLSFTNPANYKAKNVTIIGQNGAKIAGFSINGWSATSNIEIDGLTFKNVTFTSGLLLSTKVMKDVTVEECNFVNDACIHQNDRTESLTNLVVTDCTFTGVTGGNTTAVMLENTENVTVTGCTFNNIDFNVLQSGILTGTVLIDDNTVNGTGDRVFRFVDASNANITISNNTIVSNGDGDGELAKASKPTKVTLTNNTWNGKSDAEVASKLININRATVSTASELVEAIKNNNNGIKDIDLVSDITVDQWIMFSETKTISSGQIITVTMDGLNIDGKDHTLTVNSIESASNGNLLFDDASNLNIKNLTINYAAGVAGGISLKSGVISKVNFVGGNYGIYPGVGGDILVEDCTFATKADALYFEQERDNLTINRCTFNQLADKNVVLLRGDVKFTNNTVNSGRTVNIVSGSPVVTGNDFNDVRLKVYSAATATVSNNIINNLVFETTTHSSTFTNNTLSAAAQAALDAMNN